MIKKISRKLNSKKGVSILFGLLAFLIAAMVSVVIVSAALSAVKAANNAKTSAQDQLSLQSAVELLSKDIKGTEYKFKNTTITYSNGSIYSNVDSDPSITSNNFSDILKSAIDYLRDYGSIGPATGSFEINSYVGSSELVSKIKVSYSLDNTPYSEDGTKKYYYFYFNLTNEDENQFTTLTYSLEYDKEVATSDIQIPGTSGTGNTGKQTVTTETYTLTEFTVS